MIPKLFDTRFSEFRKVADDFNVEIDENGITSWKLKEGIDAFTVETEKLIKILIEKF